MHKAKECTHAFLVSISSKVIHIRIVNSTIPCKTVIFLQKCSMKMRIKYIKLGVATCDIISAYLGIDGRVWRRQNERVNVVSSP